LGAGAVASIRAMISSMVQSIMEMPAVIAGDIFTPLLIRAKLYQTGVKRLTAPAVAESLLVIEKNQFLCMRTPERVMYSALRSWLG
jgi:hypothetical protein